MESIHQAGAYAHWQGGAGEEVFVVAAAAVVVEVLVSQAQVGQIALAKGGPIHRVPEGRQVKALGHQLRLAYGHHVVAIDGTGVGVGLPAAQHQAVVRHREAAVQPGRRIRYQPPVGIDHHRGHRCIASGESGRQRMPQRFPPDDLHRPRCRSACGAIGGQAPVEQVATGHQLQTGQGEPVTLGKGFQPVPF